MRQPKIHSCEMESFLFWELAGELRVALKNDPGGFVIGELIDECEGMLEHTDSETIRVRCRELLAEARRPKVVSRQPVPERTE